MAIKVLLIEDDSDMLEMFTYTLNPIEFNVRVVKSDMEAVHAGIKWRPEVIVLDTSLPDEKARELCHAIRNLSRIPLLVLSVLDSADVITRLLDAGADEYLARPAPNGVLVAYLNRLARRAREEKEAS